MYQDYEDNSASSEKDLVIVGNCYGIAVLTHAELMSYNRGTLTAMGLAITIALLESLVWLAAK